MASALEGIGLRFKPFGKHDLGANSLRARKIVVVGLGGV